MCCHAKCLGLLSVLVLWSWIVTALRWPLPWKIDLLNSNTNYELPLFACSTECQNFLIRDLKNLLLNKEGELEIRTWALFLACTIDTKEIEDPINTRGLDIVALGFVEDAKGEAYDTFYTRWFVGFKEWAIPWKSTSYGIFLSKVIFGMDYIITHCQSMIIVSFRNNTVGTFHN